MEKFRLSKYVEKNKSNPTYSLSSLIKPFNLEPNKIITGFNEYFDVEKLKAQLLMTLNRSFRNKFDLSFTFKDYTECSEDCEKEGLYFEKVGIFEGDELEKELNLFETFLKFIEKIK